MTKLQISLSVALRTLPKTLLHLSRRSAKVGDIIRPRPDYNKRWGKYAIPLERYRPASLPSHQDSVFMCSNLDDLDECMSPGGNSWVLTLKPLGPVHRFDIAWSNEVSDLIRKGAKLEDASVARAANAYWAGQKFKDTSLGMPSAWEYLTPQARVLKCVSWDSTFEDDE